MKDWKKLLSPEQLKDAEYIVSTSTNDPKPTVDEFLNTLFEIADRVMAKGADSDETIS